MGVATRPLAARLYVTVRISEGRKGLSIRCRSADEEGVPVLSGPFLTPEHFDLCQWNLHIPHVTSFIARVLSFLLFCGVRNTHKHLAFCKFYEKFGQCSPPS